MKEIQLYKSNKVALVDDEDYEKVKNKVWSLTEQGYAVTWEKNGGYKNAYTISLHRFVFGCTLNDGKILDHIDRNKLNCQKANLRLATQSVNQINVGIHSTNRTGFRGVSYERKRRRYIAYIRFKNKGYRLGYFKDKVEAAIAYDDKAIELHGDLSALNFPILYGA